jgi:hypothetical protein
MVTKLSGLSRPMVVVRELWSGATGCSGSVTNRTIRQTAENRDFAAPILSKSGSICLAARQKLPGGGNFCRAVVARRLTPQKRSLAACFKNHC